MKIFPETYSVH